MAHRYIFNTSGDYVAFIQDDNLFDVDANWIGFLQNGNEVYKSNGEFLGYVLSDDRIVRNRTEPPRPRLMRPLQPLRPLRPLRPLQRLRMTRLPYPFEDVFDKGTITLSRSG